MAYTDYGEIRTKFTVNDAYISVDDLLDMCEDDMPRGLIQQFMEGEEIISTVSESGEKEDYYNVNDVFFKLPRLGGKNDDFRMLIYEIILPAVFEEYKEWLIEWTIKQVGISVKKAIDNIYPSTIKRSV